jgi:hypothetical protein
MQPDGAARYPFIRCNAVGAFLNRGVQGVDMHSEKEMLDLILNTEIKQSPKWVVLMVDEGPPFLVAGLSSSGSSERSRLI